MGALLLVQPSLSGPVVFFFIGAAIFHRLPEITRLVRALHASGLYLQSVRRVFVCSYTETGFALAGSVNLNTPYLSISFL